MSNGTKFAPQPREGQHCHSPWFFVTSSTHSLSIIEGVADRIGIIHHGKLLHVGTLAEIMALAGNPGSLEDVFLELTNEEAP